MDNLKINNIVLEVPLTNKDYIKVSIDFYSESIYSKEYIRNILDCINSKLKSMCEI